MYTLTQIRCGEPLSEASSITQKEPPAYQQLRQFVGGSIETIPFFDTFQGKRAVAFCHEEGKLEGRPVNQTATALWWREIGLSMAQQLDDVLVGNIVIIQCDTEEELRAL